MRALGAREHALVGATCLLLVLALLAVGLRAAAGEFDRGYELTATFPEIGQGIDTYADVRVRGVPVGTVEEIGLGPDGDARLTLRLEPDVTVPPHAEASIEPLSVFGPAFVALDLGDGGGRDGPALEDGDAVATAPRSAGLDDLLDRTSQLLDTLDPEQLGRVLDTSATIAGDLAPRTGELVDAAQQLTDVASRNTDRGLRLLADLDRIATELGGAGTTVSRIAGDSSRLLPPLIAAEDDLAATLDAGARASQVTSELLERHPDAVSQLAQGLLPAMLPPLAAVAGNVEVIPPFVEALTTFFGTLADVMHLEAPGGEGRLGGIEMLVRPLSLCELLDVCPGGDA